MIPISIVVTIFCLIFTLIATLIGVIYTRLNNDAKINAKQIAGHESRITKIEEEHKHRVELLMLTINQIKQEVQELKQFVHEKIRDEKHMYANMQQVLNYLKSEAEK